MATIAGLVVAFLVLFWALIVLAMLISNPPVLVGIFLIWLVLRVRRWNG